MKIYEETNLLGFDFWGYAIDTFNSLTLEEVNQVEACLEDCYPDGIGKTELNDIFAFDEDFIAECCGYESWEELEQAHKKTLGV